jgi:hypothetical protein
LNNEQKFVIWIGKSIHVTVTVCDIEPVAPGKIDNLTEIVIKPPEKHFKKLTNDKKECIKKTNYKNETFDFLSQYNRRDNLILRAVPFKELTEKNWKVAQSFQCFCVQKRRFQKYC